MIWANVTKFGQNFIAPQNFLGWYGYVYTGNNVGKISSSKVLDNEELELKLKFFLYIPVYIIFI